LVVPLAVLLLRPYFLLGLAGASSTLSYRDDFESIAFPSASAASASPLSTLLDCRRGLPELSLSFDFRGDRATAESLGLRDGDDGDKSSSILRLDDSEDSVSDTTSKARESSFDFAFLLNDLDRLDGPVDCTMV